MPFLWVVPLALYLLTFVLVFAPRTILPLRWMVRLQPFLIVVTAATLLCNGTGLREVLLFGSLHLATFFVTAMVCHGQLAADRPEPSQLTEFYLWMSLGGVVGGLFSALVAPVVFQQRAGISADDGRGLHVAAASSSRHTRGRPLRPATAGDAADAELHLGACTAPRCRTPCCSA